MSEQLFVGMLCGCDCGFVAVRTISCEWCFGDNRVVQVIVYGMLLTGLQTMMSQLGQVTEALGMGDQRSVEAWIDLKSTMSEITSLEGQILR